MYVFRNTHKHTHKYRHTCNNNEGKRQHDFEIEQGLGVHGRIWRKEREKGNEAIIL